MSDHATAPAPAPPKATLYVGMPHCGPVWDAAVDAQTYAATRESCGRILTARSSNSIACAGFNDLVAEALELRDQGVVTHFAMIHSDVAAPHYWFDVLLGEMLSVGADLISAVVAIKADEPDPPTSTAVGSVISPWKPVHRLRLSEVHRLPRTFTAADLTIGDDRTLLVNTGLWVADLRHPAWDSFPGFACHTRIRKSADGWVSECIPEDWNASRWLASEGVRLAATWALPVDHLGTRRWSNQPAARGHAARGVPWR